MKRTLSIIVATLFYVSAYCQETLQSVTDRGSDTYRIIRVIGNTMPTTGAGLESSYHPAGVLYTGSGFSAIESRDRTNSIYKDFSINALNTRFYVPVGGKFVFTNGNIGVGNNSPESQLHIGSNDGAKDGVYKRRLTLEPPSHTGGGWDFKTKDDASYAYLSLGYINEILTLIHTGNVGIGTTSPTEKLSVKGKIRAQEIKVEAAGIAWPDYVFTKGYRLTPLTETEAFIKVHQHLPEIPSKKEVEENGISLGEMNAKMLKKIEELTLHLIALNKKLEEQVQRNGEQQEEIDKLKNQEQ